MSRLRNRIAAQPWNARAATAGYHPWGNADTPMTMPMVHVQRAAGGTWVQQMVPAAAPGGTMVPGLAPGRFGHPAAAGGGRY